MSMSHFEHTGKLATMVLILKNVWQVTCSINLDWHSPCPCGLGNTAALSEETAPYPDYAGYLWGGHRPRACPRNINCQPLKHNFLIIYRSWKKPESCTQMQDCLGLVCLQIESQEVSFYDPRWHPSGSVESAQNQAWSFWKGKSISNFVSR